MKPGNNSASTNKAHPNGGTADLSDPVAVALIRARPAIYCAQKGARTLLVR